MRIALLARSLEPGGMERQLVELARRIPAMGHQVSVVLFYGGGRLQNELQTAGIRCVALGKRGRWDVVGFLVRLVRAIRRERPDVIHSFLVVPNLVLALLRPILPGAALVWGVRASAMDLSHYDWFARVTFALTRLVARVPDLIICNSRAGLEDHRRLGYPADRMLLIPNGIDTERFRPSCGEADSLRHEWGIDGVYLVGVVARLDPKKGHEVLIDALPRLADRGIHVVMVGGGAAARRRDLTTRARRLRVDHLISWAGDRADMERVYHALDILCLPSVFGEGFPNVVGEAMACGVPAVVTDVGDAADVVGDTGVTVPPGDPRGLANGILLLLDRLERRGDELREGARRDIVEKFGADRLATRTLGALERLR